MLATLTKDIALRMSKSTEAMLANFSKLRTGRANPALLDQVTVNYYGVDTPLNQVANVTVGDARTLIVTPWEKNLVSAVEKAILGSDLGLNPATNGYVIRVPMPVLTEERRKELIKIVRSEAETSRISIRNIRRDANQRLKNALKEKEITEDEERCGQESIQKFTDQAISKLEKHSKNKEADLMKV